MNLLNLIKTRGVFLLLLFPFSTVPFLYALEETSDAESSESMSSGRRFASGLKQVAYTGPKDFAKETVKEIPKKPPLIGMVEGVNEGTKKLLDNTLRGAYRVATLGQSELESYEIEEPEKGSDETTKIKIPIPGT